MSEKLHTFDDDPIGLPALLPAVTFGLRAAALAGMVISVGVSEAAASGLLDDPDPMGWPGITCCPPEN